MWIRRVNQLINLDNVFDVIKAYDEIRFFYAGSEEPDAIFKFSSEKEAEEIMSYINKEVETEVANKVSDVKNEIPLWREEMKAVFASKDDADKLRGRLSKRISKAENTMILWNFVF